MSSSAAKADGPDEVGDDSGVACCGRPEGRSLVEIRFDARDTAVGPALDRIGDELKDAGLRLGDRDTVRIVLAEVFNNIVEHAYAGRAAGKIVAHVEPSEDGVLCTVRDTGIPMPPGPLPGEAFPTVDPLDVDGLPEGDFGWAMVRHLTRDLVYERQGAENFLCFTIPPD